jgi:nucleoside-diphosphate-sugar epimerase
MTLHVVVGAGPVGTAVALHLAGRGEAVRLVSRSGGGPATGGVEHVAADATDADQLAGIAAGAAAIYNCASPPYHRWPTDWPPLATSVLSAAERTGAVLVTMSNLYGYGPADHPLSESDPLAATGPKGKVRAAVWRQALAACQAGRVKVTEARAADFFGPGVRQQSPAGRSVPRLLAGRPVRVLGDPDAPHSWTYVPDIAATLAVLATDQRAWGHAWHVPTNPPMSQREILTALARDLGAPAPKLTRTPPWAVRAVGVVVPVVHELAEVRYQFDRPFVTNSSACQETFGVKPTPATAALAATAAWWRGQGRATSEGSP